MNGRGRDVLGDHSYFASQTNSITSVLEGVTVKVTDKKAYFKHY
jgi:hypothetical protein